MRPVTYATSSACIPAIASILLFTPTVFAQNTDAYSSNILEEITVTARKREESLQDIPISIQTFSGDFPYGGR